MTKNTVAIEKSTKSDESTNSVERPITLILFSSNRNLTRTELKKTFAVKKGKLFHVRKEHASVADVFDNLFAVRASRPAEALFFNYKSKNPITHFYIVGQGTCVKEFAILKYGTQLLGGFDACTSELLAIKKLLEAYRVITLFCMEGKSSLNRLHHQVDEIIDSQLMDSTAYSNLLSKSAQELNNMTYPIICLAKDKVDEWYDRHFWKDVDGSPEAMTDKSIQLSASDAAAS